MSAPKPPQQPAQGIEQPPDLTDDDEAALDKAWDTITDADIEASITWLDEVDNDDGEE